MKRGGPARAGTVDHLEELRRRAERRLEPTLPASSQQDLLRLPRELEVRNIELEIQAEELRSARSELEKGLRRYTELFDFAPIGYATLDWSGRIADINFRAAQLLGKPRAQLCGLALAPFISFRQRDRVREMLARTCRDGRAESSEVELAVAGTRPTTVRVVATPLPLDEATVLLALDDVSELVEQRRARAETERALREADRRKELILAALSRELKNPLAPIRNAAFVLTRAEPASDLSRRAHVIIERQLNQLTRVVDDLLDLTNIARGEIQLRCEPLDLRELVQRSIEDHRASFEQSGVRLELRLVPAPLPLVADRFRLAQVLESLLGNALKFNARGGHVLVSLERDHNRATLRIRDDGAGIPAHVIASLFEPFAQAEDTLDRARGGLGLGLAMVRALIELHGGSAQITSEGPGRGAEATLSLPLHPPAELPSIGPEAKSPTPHRHRVLVIEGNLDAAESLRDTLTCCGHDVQIAGTSALGLSLARRMEPSVVICDVDFPGVEVGELGRALRALGELRNTYLVALTSATGPAQLLALEQAGFDQHLYKPYRIEQLARVLASSPRANTGSTVFTLHQNAPEGQVSC